MKKINIPEEEQKKQWTNEELINEAHKFFKEIMPETIIQICTNCGAENCINNEMCIKCNCQL